MPNDWSWPEDRQWSSARLIKGGDAVHYAWGLEVRSENKGAGTRRLGELFLHAHADGTLTMSLREEEGV